MKRLMNHKNSSATRKRKSSTAQPTGANDNDQDDVVKQKPIPEKVAFDFKKTAGTGSNNMSGESQYKTEGSAEEENEDSNMITKFNLKKKGKKMGGKC